jgi:hypothetical protein
MAEAATTIMGKNGTNVGSRPQACRVSDMGLAIADLLKKRYPTLTSKQVAADLSRVGTGEVTIKAAENILSGHLSARSLTRVTLAYGLSFLLEAGAAVTGKTLHDYIVEEKERARNERETWEARERELENLEAAVCRGGPKVGRLDRRASL